MLWLLCLCVLQDCNVILIYTDLYHTQITVNIIMVSLRSIFMSRTPVYSQGQAIFSKTQTLKFTPVRGETTDILFLLFV